MGSYSRPLIPALTLLAIISFPNSPGSGDGDDLYWMVIVHCSVAVVPITPEQRAEEVETYPTGHPFSVTSYTPFPSLTVVPTELPGKEAGEGLFPATVRLKSDALLFPPQVMITFLTTINWPKLAFAGSQR
jgi:hypothetical protein